MAKKLRQYVVIRHGSNAANQSMTPRAAIGVVEARSNDEAHALALKKFVFYNNQICEVIAESRSRREDREAAYEAQLYQDEERKQRDEVVEDVKTREDDY